MLEELIVRAIPFIIPVILVCSWIVNHTDTPASGGQKGETDGVESSGPNSRSKDSEKEAKSSSEQLSDRDMTHP